MFEIDVAGVDALRAVFAGVPKGIQTALGALTEFIVGLLKVPEPYKYVSRARAYGQTFQSDKQRRWFWANGGPSMIGNNRTGESTNAWTYSSTSNGYTVSNTTPGAYWTQGDSQANQPALVGWLKYKNKIEKNWSNALQVFKDALSAFF